MTSSSILIRWEEDELRWRDENDTTVPTNNWNTVPISNIIAWLPTSSTLLYTSTTTNNNPDDPSSSSDKPSTSSLSLQSLHVPKSDSEPRLTSLSLPESSPFIRSTGSNPPPIHIVVSTGSGTGQARQVFTNLLQPLLAHLHFCPSDYTVHFTTSETSVSDFTTQTLLPTANAGHAQLLILLSGDGGMVDIVNAILHSKSPPPPTTNPPFHPPTIALLPLGTGNALANSSKITSDRTCGLRTLLLGHAKPVPIFRAAFSPGARLLVDEGSTELLLPSSSSSSSSLSQNQGIIYGCVVCSWGFHATLVADSDTAAYRKHGAQRFQLAAKEALFPSDGRPAHAYRGTVTMTSPSFSRAESSREDDAGKGVGETVKVLPRKTHAYVVATLVQQLEAGFAISPSSRPLDGQLRVIEFGAMDGTATMEVMKAAYAGGKHVGMDAVGYHDVAALRIEVQEEEEERWRRVCVDGKIVRVERDGWVEVEVVASQRAVVELLVLESR